MQTKYPYILAENIKESITTELTDISAATAGALKKICEKLKSNDFRERYIEGITVQLSESEINEECEAHDENMLQTIMNELSVLRICFEWGNDITIFSIIERIEWNERDRIIKVVFSDSDLLALNLMQSQS